MATFRVELDITGMTATAFDRWSNLSLGAGIVSDGAGDDLEVWEVTARSPEHARAKVLLELDRATRGRAGGATIKTIEVCS